MKNIGQRILFAGFLTLTSLVCRGQNLDIEEGSLGLISSQALGIKEIGTIRNTFGDIVVTPPGSRDFVLGPFHDFIVKKGNVEVEAGGRLILNSSDSTQTIDIYHDNAGGFTMSTTPLLTQFYLDGANNRLGLFSALPDSELEVLQQLGVTWNGFGSIVTNNGGITIEAFDGDKVGLAVDQGDDLIFSFNTAGRAYISNTNGKFFNAANSGTGGAIRSDISKSKNVHLDKVQNIWIGEGRNKSSNSNGLIVDGKQLQKLYPSMVDYKEGSYGIATSDFGLIAIKAIQEQQEIIELLIQRIEILEN